MPKVTMIGAGSAVFARQVMTDILLTDGLDKGTFALVDVDAERLELARGICEKLVQIVGKEWTVEASTDRRDMLPGTDFIVNSIEVAGVATVRDDYEIPLKYGVDQAVADTIGPGGIFKALRTGPAWLDILRDAEKDCPRALVLNYTNPMSLLTLAALRGSTLSTVGLCHSIQGTSRRLATYLDVPYQDLQWRAAGINHNAWFTKLEYEGEDMYPRLRERAADPAVYAQDPVRFEMMLQLGAFVSESSHHFSEYVPYFRKRRDLLERYCSRDGEVETGLRAKRWPTRRAANDDRIREMLAGDREIPLERSHEYASDIIAAVVFDRPTVIYGNVRNTGLIDNLLDGCVEVACMVDRNGLHPCHFGPLPEQLAALNRTHMAVHNLVVQALLERDRQAALYALMLDPLTAAVCSLAEIRQLFDEMWERQRQYLPDFA